jgi:hypothetical protein
MWRNQVIIIDSFSAEILTSTNTLATGIGVWNAISSVFNAMKIFFLFYYRNKRSTLLISMLSTNAARMPMFRHLAQQFVGVEDYPAINKRKLKC